MGAYRINYKVEFAWVLNDWSYEFWSLRLFDLIDMNLTFMGMDSSTINKGLNGDIAILEHMEYLPLTPANSTIRI